MRERELEGRPAPVSREHGKKKNTEERRAMPDDRRVVATNGEFYVERKTSTTHSMTEYSNKGVELYTESNPTPYVKRPELLVLGKDGADPG